MGKYIMNRWHRPGLTTQILALALLVAGIGMGGLGIRDIHAVCNPPNGVRYELTQGSFSIDYQIGPDGVSASASGTYKYPSGTGDLLVSPGAGLFTAPVTFSGTGTRTEENGTTCLIGVSQTLVIRKVKDSEPPTNPPDAPPPKDLTQKDKNTNSKDPVDTRMGNMYFDTTDIAIPCPGVPLEFTRNYNSFMDTESTLGCGWRHTYEWQIRETRQLVETVVILAATNPNRQTCPSAERFSMHRCMRFRRVQRVGICRRFLPVRAVCRASPAEAIIMRSVSRSRSGAAPVSVATAQVPAVAQDRVAAPAAADQVPAADQGTGLTVCRSRAPSR